MNYQQLSFANTDAAQREMLIALLGDINFEGFEEKEDLLVASIPESLYNKDEVEVIASQFELSFTEETIAQQNWNALWESSFEPVVVPGFCTVRASFHELPVATPYEIVITPKMSFGTGHHATTQLMIECMQEIVFEGLNVLDFGTGTGILAILAKKLGAATGTAIDNDEWSITNAVENAAMNECAIVLAKASLEDIAESQYEIVLANINRNILLQHMEAMSNQVIQGGVLLLSGILPEDESVITNAALAAGFTTPAAREKNNWMSIQFLKA